MKKDFFKLKDHGTTVRREVLAGITTFMTMAYVLAVQPSAICGFGPDPYITDINGIVISKSALLVMCALVSGIITLFMGLYANLPLALSTAMGSNFILGGLVNSGTVSFGWAGDWCCRPGRCSCWRRSGAAAASGSPPSARSCCVLPWH